MRFDIVDQSFGSAFKCQPVYGDDDREHDKDRHHDLAHLLDSLLNTAQYNDGSECKEQQEPSDRLERTADKVCKISISGRVLHAAADKYGEIFHHPSADNGVVRENDDRNDNGKQS